MKRILPRLLLTSLPLLVALLSCAWSGFCFAARPFSEQRSARVLVLHSFSPGVYRTDGLSRGITDQLAKAPRNIQQMVVYLDASIVGKSSAYPSYLEGKLTVLKAMLAAAPVDAVLLTDWKAMEFWAANHAEFSPELPVVYCGVGDAVPPELLSLGRATGVLERPGFGDTIREATRLFPKADKLLVVGERSLHFQANRDMLRSDLAPFAPRLAVEFLDDLEVSAIESRLAQLGPGWVVFVVGRPEKDGKLLVQSEAASRLAAASPAPVFTAWGSWMGFGPVGGKIILPEEQGAAAARRVIEILDGKPVKDIPSAAEDNGRFMFDFKALERFGLSEAELPQGSLVLNRPATLYESYRHLVWMYGLMMLLLVAACFLLVLYIVNRRRMQNKLSAQVNFVQSLMEAMPTPVFYKDVKGIYQGCNPAFAEFMGLSPEELIGHSVFDLYPEEEANVYKVKDDALFAAGPIQIYEYEKMTPAGPRQIRFHKALYHDADRKVAGLVGVIADITDLRRAEREVEKTLKYLQAIFDSSPSTMFSVDAEGNITHANAQARTACGECSLDRAQATLAHVENLLDHVQRAIAEGRVITLPRRISMENGAMKAEDVIIYPLASLGLSEAVVRIDDVTERHRMQELLVQSEKMMSVGGLAAGMAHEINNPLGGIMQSAQVIRTRLLPDLPGNLKSAGKAGCPMESILAYLEDRQIPELLDGLRDSARRAAGIVSNMLEFSKRSSSAWLPVDVNAVVEKAVDLCLQDYNLSERYDFKRIEIRREFDSQTLSVPCSGPQIQQVVFNLLRNAAQAMAQAQTPGPAIVVRTRSDGECAIIEVEDNGPGMDESTRRKVFEPFFTTKSPGQGTGLGLSVSYFIVHENHGGEIEVESEPGRGARFLVKLPLRGRRCF
ncbi:ATP-binding protein [Fundidesulfovibrio terrae]|uniref:ATP-binding protein n=1 Tax=Fundidesulfovibrio terrae TaxID=2922866 RepID=UPI001FB01EC0|nr:ATP-binding protein [Fundidesulfovibrio terrae]